MILSYATALTGGLPRQSATSVTLLHHYNNEHQVLQVKIIIARVVSRFFP